MGLVAAQEPVVVDPARQPDRFGGVRGFGGGGLCRSGDRRTARRGVVQLGDLHRSSVFFGRRTAVVAGTHPGAAVGVDRRRSTPGCRGRRFTEEETKGERCRYTNARRHKKFMRLPRRCLPRLTWPRRCRSTAFRRARPYPNSPFRSLRTSCSWTGIPVRTWPPSARPGRTLTYTHYWTWPSP